MPVLNNVLRRLGHQEYLRFGARDRIIRFFHNPAKPGAGEFAVPFFGLTYPGKFDTFLDWSVYYYGAYSREELALIGDVLDTLADPVVLDVGANAGHHTLFLSRQSRKVYAFEPFPQVSAKIDAKLNANGVANVEVCRFGLGAENTEASYFPPASTNTGTGSFLSENAQSPTSPALRLQIRKGDDVVAENGLDKLDFIKMDVEGFEVRALRGLSGTLAKFRPVVFVEWTQNNLGEKGMNAGKDLFPKGYRFFQFIEEVPRFVLFREKHYRLKPVGECWEDGNVLAVPEEHIEKINARNPLPALAQRLKGSDG